MISMPVLAASDWKSASSCSGASAWQGVRAQALINEGVQAFRQLWGRIDLHHVDFGLRKSPASARSAR